MTSIQLDDIALYRDQAAASRGEPGIWNSYIAAMMTVLQCLGENPDPAWVMGASSWAFRIIVHKDLCPSATSVFEWNRLLPEAVGQAGHNCTYVSRLWHETELAEARQAEAHAVIVRGLERGVPAIAWDLAIPEWELITGVDDASQDYLILSCQGKPGRLARVALGDREIKILSVTVVGEPNERSRSDIVRRSLEAAVHHAHEGELMDRPDYLDGLPAYGHWADALEPGREDSVNWEFAEYYAAQWVGARCYARDYLELLAQEYPGLTVAAETYRRLASELIPVWEAFSISKYPPSNIRILLSGRLRRAAEIERDGVRQLENFLIHQDRQTL